MPAPIGSIPLILASRSVRRLSMLRDAGFEADQIDPHFDDPADPACHRCSDLRELVQRLAEQKLCSVEPGCRQCPDQAQSVILSADTIGQTQDGQLLGTPQTHVEALRMLRLMMGRKHTIASAVVWAWPGGRETVVDTASVQMGMMNPADLYQYVGEGRWRGKAGGYNLAECCEAGWPIECDGDPTTVMGLPMDLLTPRLESLGVSRKPRVASS